MWISSSEQKIKLYESAGFVNEQPAWIYERHQVSEVLRIKETICKLAL